MHAPQKNDVDLVVEIERLAALDPIKYEAVRSESAQRLGLRASILDREVTKKRRSFGVDVDNDGQGRSVKVPEVLPWHDPVHGDFVASTLAAATKIYAILSDWAADTIALWVMHTWLVNECTISPRLAITSPTKGCGKTTILRFLNKVVCRPKRAGSISPAALFRLVEQCQPTIMLDETEKYIEHGSDLHALLNEGHCKGGTVVRVLGEKSELREFSIFSAVAFARNGRLPDDLEQRSIVIEMQRRRPNETLVELREDRCEALENIARMCARWVEGIKLDGYDPNMGGLINRNADNWRPLFAIADIIGFDWPERIREAAAVLGPRESCSTSTVLLADIKAAFDEKNVDRLASADLCEALTAMEGRPWADWKAGKALTPNQLARLLKPFRVIPDSVRVGNRTPKGYYRFQFEEPWQRYLAAEAQQRNDPQGIGISCILQSATFDAGAADRQGGKLAGKGSCCGGAVRKGSQSLESADGPHCDHCRRPGTEGDPLLDVFDGERDARLHRGCLASWTSNWVNDCVEAG